MAFAEALHPGIIAPVSSTEVFLPPFTRVFDIPRSSIGIDEATIKSRKYEESVIDYVASVTGPNYFIFGPGALEKALINDRGLSIPDYLGAELVDGNLIVRELGEAKLGPRYFSTQKIKGFKNFIETYRLNPQAFQQKIEQTLEAKLPLLQIPEKDPDIEIHFVAPRNISQGHVQEIDTEFRVFYWPLAES